MDKCVVAISTLPKEFSSSLAFSASGSILSSSAAHNPISSFSAARVVK